MQPAIQHSHIVRHRVSTSLAPLRARNASRPFTATPEEATLAVLTIDFARNLLALLPGRAAILDASGLVIAWNDNSSPTNEYKIPACNESEGPIVAPLGGTGGATLIWAPGANHASGFGKKPSRALNTIRAQIEELALRLMHAQEDERKKIARELHDDLGQRLAAHALAINHLKQHPPGSPVALKERLLALEADAVELGESIRQVSHDLHPSLLERLGLAGALRAFASEFCKWSGLRLVPDIQNPPGPLPSMIPLAAYRIAQEAIRNIKRHAQATTIQLKLRFTANYLHLAIKDDGVGFTATGPLKKKGLGLTSIEERVHLLNGRLSIVGARGHGTILTVRLPFSITGP